MKLLGIVLAVQVALGLTLVALVATDNLPFAGDGKADGSAPRAPAAAADRFDGAAAFRLLRRQVELGPRPAGSPQSRRLARLLKRIVPRGRYQEVPGGLRNVIGTVRGREPGYVVVGAHYDTKDIPGFVGANDGASGTAVAAQLARTIRRPRHTVQFVFLDGEEAPRGVPDSEFERYGLRGSRVAAPELRDARAMILLDFVGDRRLSIPREAYSSEPLWARLRAAARRVGAERVFPDRTRGGILDDHIPFLRHGVRHGVPSIDLIDFDFPCWHRLCDDLPVVSERSVDAVGETVYELLRGL
ncbi:MAG TPA: M28 family metallopeptidase [Thermoleophilaceae bacterium]|nr:M28 family metallopeptidase [Thermoleophilaceae bacterium]